MKKAFIRAISYYLPEKKLTNGELASLFPEWDEEAIFQRTGIRERGISAPGELSSDKAVKAAEIFFAEHKINRQEIDFVVFCTQTPDYITPSSACVIQARLGLPNNIGALDVNLGCTGFVYALSLAKGLIETGTARNVLLLNSESLTGLLHPGDKGSRILFGDAGSATLVSGREREGVGSFAFGTDGTGLDVMIIKAGAFRHPKDKDISFPDLRDEYGNTYSDEHFYMNGVRVLSFSIEICKKMVDQLLASSNFSMDDIDYFIFHQANGFVLNLLQRKLKIPKEKFCIHLQATGNTVSCTIPIALRDALDAGNVKDGDKIMLVSFGVGLSGASTIITL